MKKNINVSAKFLCHVHCRFGHDQSAYKNDKCYSCHYDELPKKAVN